MNVWRCSCGEEWPENGDGVACGQAWRHLQDAALNNDKENHKPIGLVDPETDEVLSKGFNASVAIRKGYIKKREDSLYARRKRAKEEKKQKAEGPQAAEVTDSGEAQEASQVEATKNTKRKKTATPLKGRIPLVQIDIPPELWFLYVLAMAKFPSLEESPDSFTEWLTYCVFKLYTLYADVFGLKQFLVKAAEGRGIEFGEQGN